MSTTEEYFTPEQLDTLRTRRLGLTEQRAREVQAQWAELAGDVRVSRSLERPLRTMAR